MQGVRTVAEEMRQRFEGQPLAECNIILASSYRTSGSQVIIR
jgi:hypothetical protein